MTFSMSLHFNNLSLLLTAKPLTTLSTNLHRSQFYKYTITPRHEIPADLPKENATKCHHMFAISVATPSLYHTGTVSISKPVHKPPRVYDQVHTLHFLVNHSRPRLDATWSRCSA